MNTRQFLARGLKLLMHFEGLSTRAYICPAGKWTIGYGHTRMAFAGQEITQAQAEALLARDVAEMAQGVSKLVQVPLNDAQFSALVCFAFNVGLGAFERSTLLRLLNRGWVDQVPAQLMRWTKAGGKELPGLRRRRAAEAALWRSDDMAGKESA